MKKAINRNFILVIILSLALMLVPVGIGIIVKGIEEDVQEIEQKMELLEADDFGSTGDMYELSAEYEQGVGNYAKMIFYVVLFVVGGYSLLLFLTGLLAWMIYLKNPKRLPAYRVLMTVNYLLQAGVIYIMVDMLFEQFSIVVLLLVLLVLSALLYSAFYTYSKRIRTESA